MQITNARISINNKLFRLIRRIINYAIGDAFSNVRISFQNCAHKEKFKLKTLDECRKKEKLLGFIRKVSVNRTQKRRKKKGNPKVKLDLLL